MELDAHKTPLQSEPSVSLGLASHGRRLQREVSADSRPQADGGVDIGSLEQKHKSEIDALKRNHDIEMASLEQKCDDDRKKHKAEIESLTCSHKTKIDSLEQNHKSGIASLTRSHKEETAALEREHKGEIKNLKDAHKKSIRLRNIFLVLLLIAVAAVGFVCYRLSQDNKTLQRENFNLRNELLSRNETREREAQAKEILAVLRSDSLVGKFFDALVYVDCDDGVRVAGSLSLPSTFSREFKDSKPERGFVNLDGIKTTLQSLYSKNFVVKSDLRFTFETTSLKTWTEKKNLIEEAAFLSTKNLRPVQEFPIAELESKIADHLDSTLRFLFRTDREGVYVAAVVRGSRLTERYLASDNNAVERDSFLRELWEKVRQSDFDGEENVIQISLWKADERLERGIDFNECVEIFLNQLLERSR